MSGKRVLDDGAAVSGDAATAVQAADVPAAAAKLLHVGDDFDSLLSQYYQRLFPFRMFYEWLSYGNNRDTFVQREFSMTLKDDIYVRYQSYDSADKMRSQITDRVPIKIDIGAVFSRCPADRSAYTDFRPLWKEVVIDIDMTDYDSIRRCCKGASVCPKCWRFMTAAAMVLRAALSEDFGFQNLLWVFSGRRGLHCWICDKRARMLNQEARSALADNLDVFSKQGDHRNITKGEARLVYPLERAYRILEPIFERHIVLEQGYFDSETEQFTMMMQMIPDESLRQLRQELLKRGGRFEAALYDIVLWFTYPRLDVNVTKGLNHLLKSPLCVHPKTGKICVPLNIDTIDQFDPTRDAPLLQNVIHEIDAYNRDHPDGPKLHDWKKTSLRPFLEHMEAAFLRPLRRALDASGETAAALSDAALEM